MSKDTFHEITANDSKAYKAIKDSIEFLEAFKTTNLHPIDLLGSLPYIVGSIFINLPESDLETYFELSLPVAKQYRLHLITEHPESIGKI